MILTGFATGTFFWFLLSPNSKQFVRSRGNSVFAVIYCTCFSICIIFFFQMNVHMKNIMNKFVIQEQYMQ